MGLDEVERVQARGEVRRGRQRVANRDGRGQRMASAHAGGFSTMPEQERVSRKAPCRAVGQEDLSQACAGRGLPLPARQPHTPITEAPLAATSRVRYAWRDMSGDEAQRPSWHTPPTGCFGPQFVPSPRGSRG
jgi:hypothetical protein